MSDREDDAMNRDTIPATPEHSHDQQSPREASPVTGRATTPSASRPALPSKNPYLAAILSGFPGAGNIYNGLYMRAIVFFMIIASLIGLAHRGNELFGFAVAFFWIFNVLDAYRQATLINLGLVTDLGIAEQPETPYGQGGIAAGIILFVIGLFALVDDFVYIDLDWLLDLWPVAFMALGGWLVWASVKEKRERSGSVEPVDPL